GDFETGDLTGFNPSGNSPTVTDERSRAGTYAMRTSLDRYVDTVAFRTEVVPHGQTFEVGDEVWYGFSIYLPDDYVADPVWEIPAQWHGRPDFDLGEDWRNPPLALHSSNGQWTLSIKWDAKANTFESGEREYDGSESEPLGPYETGRWTDWVFHLVWSYQDDGVLQIWKDGVQVLERLNKPNTFNDAEGPYMKMGIYKGWKDPATEGVVDSRLLFHDELRIAVGAASYCDVAP
ncbi:MAG: polysaccharide lyase, partial [Deltaproteobacteria bacterium]|nr:polysaccharide lyase [Deltaproteobacteria bacterium]MBW2533228.1 polysaccharide lyase [Deltaproteobacteria bacterium]